MGVEVRSIKFQKLNEGFSERGYFKASVGTPAFVDIQFDLFLVSEEKSIKVKQLEQTIDGDPVYRFELDRADEDFEAMFKIGDTATCDGEYGMFNYQGKVVFISDQVMEMQVTDQGQYGQSQGQEGEFDPVVFMNYTRPEYVEVKYALGSSSAPEYNNYFDRGIQKFGGRTSDGSLTSLTGNVRNFQVDGGNPTFQRGTTTRIPQINGQYPERTLVQDFKLNNLPLLVPFWNNTFAQNYENDTFPDVFRGEQSLKLYAEIITIADLEKTKRPFKFELEQEVDIGWYNEDGNGGYTDIKKDSLSYFNTDTGFNSNSLSVNQESLITARISRENGTFENNDDLVLQVFKKVEFDRYFESSVPSGETYLSSWRRSKVSSGSQISRGLYSLDNINVNKINNQTLEITATHKTRTYERNLLDQGDKYVLALTFSTTRGSGQSVAIILDQNVYSKDTDEDNLIQLVKGRTMDPDLLPLPPASGEFIYDADPDMEGYSKASLWNEDGVISWWRLRQFSTTGTEILKMKFRLVANRTSAKDGKNDYSDRENYVIINEKDIPIQQIGQEDNIPRYTSSELRAFNLRDSDIFKSINVFTWGQGSGFANIDVQVAHKIDWKNWIQLQNGPSDLYVQDDSYYGYNKRTSNYSDEPYGTGSANNFQVYAQLLVEMQNVTNPFTTEYAFEIPLTVFDQGEDQHTRNGDFADWTGEIFTERMDGTDLNGSILTTEATKMKIHWTNNGRLGAVPLWFMHRIEEVEQPNWDIWELSTLREPIQQCPLQPLAGVQDLLIYSDGANGYWSECKIDHTLLDSGTSYKISGRIGQNETGAGSGFAYSIGFTVGFDS